MKPANVCRRTRTRSSYARVSCPLLPTTIVLRRLLVCCRRSFSSGFFDFFFFSIFRVVVDRPWSSTLVTRATCVSVANHVLDGGVFALRLSCDWCRDAIDRSTMNTVKNTTKRFANRKFYALPDDYVKVTKTTQKSADPVKLTKYVDENVIGKSTTFSGPYGRRKGNCCLKSPS